MSDKLQMGYRGPFIISEKLSDILYKVKADTSHPNPPKPPGGIISPSRMKIMKENNRNEVEDTDNYDVDDSYLPDNHFPHE